MRDLTALAIDAAKHCGASYADIRIVETQSERLCVRNGSIAAAEQGDDLGFGIRVIVDGSWGFASCSKLNRREIKRVAALAVDVAKASSRLQAARLRLAPEQAFDETWCTPHLVDPFDISPEEKLHLLHQIDGVLRKSKRIAAAESRMAFRREHKWLRTSEGTFVDQTLLRSGVGYAVTSADGKDSQRRSYPNSHNGQVASMGYELVRGLPLLENAERIREEAVALLKAKPCPSGKKDLILDPTQLALQIHESCGHPSELDRVLGQEANYAGTSFLTTDKLGKLKYGSSIVNLVADNALPTGLATQGFDDDGVPAQRWHIVKNGVLSGYMTNREVAHDIDEPRSRGCCRADGWQSLPMIRIANLSLMPGDADFDELVSDTKDGVLMECNKSWSIDQQRLNFQFGTEIAWEIKNGKLGAVLKNPTYQGITPQFWNGCDAICSAKHWRLWGVSNCGKGQPGQTSAMSHGAAPARFRNVTVGVAQ